ncbi:MAG: hypothetical protein KC561_07290, partial [Myxococcales bacterium]|nr:hypothetical protein [Myxococcales bacterium]
CGAVTGTPEGWSPQLATRIFVGTQYGCLLRIDTSGPDPLTWNLDVLDQASQEGMIHYPPAIARRTGGDLTVIYSQGTPDTEFHPNRITALVSVNEETTTATFVVENEDEEEDSFQYTTLVPPDLETRSHVNYELQFDDGEEVTAAPFIADGVTYFATWAPAEDLCQFGMARLWGINFIGDGLTSGSDPVFPFIVDETSDRLVPELDNPDFTDDPDSEEPEFIPYLTSIQLSGDPEMTQDYSIIYGLEVTSVPQCEQVQVRRQGDEYTVVGGSTERRLDIAMLRTENLDLEGSEGWASTAQTAAVSVPFELPQAEAEGFALDWGSIMEF